MNYKRLVIIFIAFFILDLLLFTIYFLKTYKSGFSFLKNNSTVQNTTNPPQSLFQFQSQIAHTTFSSVNQSIFIQPFYTTHLLSSGAHQSVIVIITPDTQKWGNKIIASIPYPNPQDPTPIYSSYYFNSISKPPKLYVGISSSLFTKGQAEEKRIILFNALLRAIWHSANTNIDPKLDSSRAEQIFNNQYLYLYQNLKIN